MVDYLEVYAGSSEQIARDAQMAKESERLEQCGRAWFDMMFASGRLKRQGILLERVSIRVGWTTGTDSLVTLVGTGPDGGLVAFHGAENPQRLWERLTARMLADTLRWRTDLYDRRHE